MKIIKWALVAASAALLCLLFFGRLITNGAIHTVSAQSYDTARIYYVDMGQSTGTLVVSPSGKTLLIDAGPTNGGGNKLLALLDKLGINTIDYAIVTNYRADHTAGMAALLYANRIGGVVFDNGN